MSDTEAAPAPLLSQRQVYTVFGGLLFFVLVDWAFSEILGH